jgi:hypothetical protein
VEKDVLVPTRCRAVGPGLLRRARAVTSRSAGRDGERSNEEHEEYMSESHALILGAPERLNKP